MGVLFIESFDDRSTANALYKWSVVGSTNTIGTTYGRNGYGLYLSGDGNQFLSKTVGTQTTIYVGFALYATAIWTNGTQIAVFYEGSNIQDYIDVDLTGHIRLYSGGGLVGTSTLTLTTSAWHYIEIKLVINNTTGSCIVKSDGVEYLNLTNVNTRQGTSNTWIDSVRFRSGWTTCYLDDIWMADDQFYGDCKVECLRPTGAGNYSQFTPSAGSNYQNVDDPSTSAPCPNGDTDYNSSSTLGNKDTFVFENMVTTSGTIYAVQVGVNARKTDAGTRTIRSLIRQNSTDYEGSDSAVSSSYQTLTEVYLTNPATSAAWTIADVNTNAEFGYKDQA